MTFKKFMLLAALTLAVLPSQAKITTTNQLYIFGFSASFKDSVIYVTDIQHLEGAWIESKHKFLLGRDQYSAQLKTYLTETLSQPGRVCMVFFALKKKDAEKQYLKLMKKYKQGYDVRYLNVREFKFDVIDMNPDE